MIEPVMSTLDEIRRRGLESLARKLGGPYGMARFLQQFESGHGDYTSERDQWLDDEDVKTVAERIFEARKSESP